MKSPSTAIFTSRHATKRILGVGLDQNYSIVSILEPLFSKTQKSDHFDVASLAEVLNIMKENKGIESLVNPLA